MKDQLQSSKCAISLKAIGDPERLKIIQCLQLGPMHVGAIADVLDAEIANVSHHLQTLKHAALVEVKKQGKFAFYSLSAEVLAENDVLELGCCRLQLGKK
ncbi:MAG: ArsR family transcriptional regulator [Gemmataceae bacterium]|nr:ArsR family transcriptional regulator [Gemmataceae bacterium]